MKILKWGFASGVLILVVLLAICLPDEDLTPEAKALLEFKPKVAAPEKNGYFLAVGRLAPAGEDGHAWGRRKVEAYARAEGRGISPNGEAQGRELMVKRLPCDDVTGDCLEMVRNRRSEFDAWLAANAEPMARYRKLREYPFFQTPYYSPRSGTPGYFATFETRATAMQIVALVIDGKTERALDELEQEIALHRRMLAGATDLIQKILASISLIWDFKLLSMLLTHHAAAMTPAVERIVGMTRPLSADELDTTVVFRTEAARSANLMMHLAEWIEEFNPEAVNSKELSSRILLSEPGRTLFYRPNNSINFSAKREEKWEKFSQLPADRLVARQAAFSSELKDGTPALGIPLNIMGRQFVREWGAIDYLFRVHDVDGLIRLIALQARLMAKGTGNADVPRLIADAGSSLHDPYTDKPMRWDAAKRQIYFIPQKGKISSSWRFADESGRLTVTLP